MPFDVVILGGGLGGLVTGAVLARAGQRVLLLEKGARVGGGAKVVPHSEWNLPVGPHGFPRDALERAFTRARSGAPIYETGRYVLYNRVKKQSYPFLESVDEPAETKIEKYNIDPADYASVTEILAHIDPETWRGRTLAEWLAALEASDRVKRLLATSAMWATDGALTPEVIAMDSFALGAFALFIGVVNWAEYSNDQQLPEAFAAAIREAGSELRTECEVEEVEIESGQVRAVRFADRRLGTVERERAEKVVLAVPFDQVVSARLVHPRWLPAAWVSAAADIARHSGGFVTTYYGLRERVIEHNKGIYLFDLDPETGTHTRPCGLIAAYSNTVPTLAPEGKQLLCSLVTIRPGERGDWGAIERKIAETERNAREYFADQGLPDIDSLRELRRVNVAMPTWGQYVWSVFYPQLPDLSAPAVEGLFFVGNMVKTTAGMFGVEATVDAALRLCDMLLAGEEGLPPAA